MSAIFWIALIVLMLGGTLGCGEIEPATQAEMTDPERDFNGVTKPVEPR